MAAEAESRVELRMPEAAQHVAGAARGAMLAPPSENFGEYLVSCRRGWAVRIVQSALAIIFLCLAGFMAYLAAICVTRAEWGGVAVLAVFISACLFLVWFFCLYVFVTMDFYECGMVWRSLVRRGVVRFDGAKRLDYNVIRSYSHGIYTGSVVTFAIYPAEGRRFRWTGGYNEKPRGMAFTIFGSTFESDDPMDIAREAMSIHVADSLTRVLDAGGEVEWSKEAILDADGIVPRAILGRQDRIPWSEIVETSFHGNSCLVGTKGSKKWAVTVQCKGRNFWPGLKIVKRKTRTDSTETAR